MVGFGDALAVVLVEGEREATFGRSQEPRVRTPNGRAGMAVRLCQLNASADACKTCRQAADSVPNSNPVAGNLQHARPGCRQFRAETVPMLHTVDVRLEAGSVFTPLHQTIMATTCIVPCCRYRLNCILQEFARPLFLFQVPTDSRVAGDFVHVNDRQGGFTQATTTTNGTVYPIPSINTARWTVQCICNTV